MRDWPEDLVAYKRTATFSAATIPPALLKDHSTKKGVWARLHILDGSLRFREAASEVDLTLSKGTHACIYPQIKHRVEPLGEVSFFVEFCRVETNDAAPRAGELEG